MSIEYTIVCDSCSRIIVASHWSAADARGAMREQGLGRTSGRQDQCVGCRDEGQPLVHGGKR